MARWRIAFKVYRNDRLVHRDDGYEARSLRDAVHSTESEIGNVDRFIEDPGSEDPNG